MSWSLRKDPAAYWPEPQKLVHSPHSQMPLWLAGSTGSAMFVLGAALLVADLARRVVWPLVAAGQLALTVYVGHLLALRAAPDTLTSDRVGTAVLLVAGFTAAAAVLATAWRARFPRGPLEATLNAPWQLDRTRGTTG